MFTLTFLGHQGWLVSTATTNLLIDPLLTDGFGHGGLLGRLYPPRVLDFDAFPPIDAVVLSHEHDDHFDIPSLVQLDRAIPIYLSSRSSIAAHALVAELGFEVRPLAPDATVEIGDLRYHSYTCDHRGAGQGDEWDVFPMFVCDAGGHGSLLSSIDVATMVTELPGPVRVWAHAHNSTRTEFQRLRSHPSASMATSSDAAALLAAVLRRFAALEASHGVPEVAWVCGQGWSFPDERAWINHEAFPVTTTQIAEALACTSPSLQAHAPAPGSCVELEHGRVVATRSAQTWIRPAARDRWPDRRFAPEHESREYTPVSGRVESSAAELDALVVELDDLARHLYAGPVFRSLCSLPPTVAGVPAAIGFSLRIDDSDARVVLRYEPSACRFVPIPAGEQPERALLSGIECYASDLLAFARGRLSPSALCYAGRLRTWNHAPQRLWFSAYELWTWHHPLRRPDRAATLYRELLAAIPESDRRPKIWLRGQPR
jgi:hypothetical protein